MTTGATGSGGKRAGLQIILEGGGNLLVCRRARRRSGSSSFGIRAEDVSVCVLCFLRSSVHNFKGEMETDRYGRAECQPV